MATRASPSDVTTIPSIGSLLCTAPLTVPITASDGVSSPRISSVAGISCSLLSEFFLVAQPDADVTGLGLANLTPLFTGWNPSQFQPRVTACVGLARDMWGRCPAGTPDVCLREDGVLLDLCPLRL